MTQFKNAAFLIKTFALLSLTQMASLLILLCPGCRFLRRFFWSESTYAESLADQNVQIWGFISALPAAAWQFAIATIPAAAVGTALVARMLRRRAADPCVRCVHLSSNELPQAGVGHASAISRADLRGDPNSADCSLRERLRDVAHELRNPLTVMRGQLDAFEDGVRRPDGASLSVLRHAVHRLDTLLLDVESLAHGVLQGLPFRMVPINVGALVESLLDGYGQALATHGFTLDLDLSTSCELLGDPERLCQAFDNLMQNSLRYTQPGGVIRIRLRDQGHAFWLTWEDSAPGVEPTQMHLLGRRGFRTATGASGQGLGLGLSIVRAIIETHGGSLRPDASELGGLRWHVWLPANERRTAR